MLCEIVPTTRQLPPNFLLAHGSHKSPDEGLCLLEAVAYVAGEPHSARPACCCPILGRIGRALNDRWGDYERQRLAPLIPQLIGTRSTRAVQRCRAYAMADALVREIAPRGLDAINWSDLADRLRTAAQIINGNRGEQARVTALEVREEAHKRWRAAAPAYVAASYAAVTAAVTATTAAVTAATAPAVAIATATAAAKYAYAAADVAAFASADKSPADRARIRLQAQRPIIEATLHAYERMIAIV